MNSGSVMQQTHDTFVRKMHLTMNWQYGIGTTAICSVAELQPCCPVFVSVYGAFYLSFSCCGWGYRWPLARVWTEEPSNGQRWPFSIFRMWSKV